MTRNSDGTSTRREALYADNVLMNSPGSLTISSGMITSGTPFSNGPKISQIESTKPSAVFWQHTSPSTNGYSRHIHSKRLIDARCALSTPLGLPVEPEV